MKAIVYDIIIYPIRIKVQNMLRTKINLLLLKIFLKAI